MIFPTCDREEKLKSQDFLQKSGERRKGKGYGNLKITFSPYPLTFTPSLNQGLWDLCNVQNVNLITSRKTVKKRKTKLSLCSMRSAVYYALRIYLSISNHASKLRADGYMRSGIRDRRTSSLKSHSIQLKTAVSLTDKPHTGKHHHHK